MNLFSTIRAELDQVIQTLDLPDGINLSAITVEPPRDASHGDLSTNAAMVLAGQAKCKPRDLAEKIAKGLEGVEGVTEVSIAGPGFINLRCVDSFWLQIIPVIAEQGAAYGDSDIGAGQKVNVEYVSANPTGPLHVGHARGAVYGDAMATLLTKAGYDITKEYYINDAGGQIDVLARSVYLRYREAMGEGIKIPEGLYPGDYLIPAGEALKETRGDALMDMEELEWLAIVKPFAVEKMMDIIRDDLAGLGIHHDIFASEKALHDDHKIETAIELLKSKELIYRGTLEPPKGKLPDDWEAREQLLFKSSEYGDDVDRALQKPNDSYTYFAADLAYAQDKIARGFNTLIYMLGADHGGYKKRMEAAISALSDKQVVCDIKLCQLVNLLKDGVPLKMSKRAGNFETVRDVINEVGKDVLRFIMLTRKSDMVMDFDLDKVKEQSKDNPVFYVQYAHARCKSLLRLAKTESAESLEQLGNADLSLLSHDAEMALIKEMAQFPRVIEAAALAAEPHRIAFYLQDLASSFHGLWGMGNKQEQLRFIIADNPQLTTARLALAKSLATVVACGLNVLGVEPLEELR